MAARSYLNFDLLVEQETEGHFQARVTGSPSGEAPSVRFTLPFDPTTLENLLLKLDPGRSDTRLAGAPVRQQVTVDFGGPLYRAIFKDDVLLAWKSSLREARLAEDRGLRLRLRLNDAPAIAGLPWELLYDAGNNSFIAQSERTPVVRYLDVGHVPRAMAVDGPLHVLAVISSPIDLPPLDVEAEWQRLREALQSRVDSGHVVLDRLPKPTMADLGTWLRRKQTHIIHFVGHGEFANGNGVIYFQDRHGRAATVTSSVLGPHIRDHDPLRMVVLNACRSARADAVDPFSGMAQGLVQQDATAVVAMQFPISDRAAMRFSGEFYGALVDGFPVDQAVAYARKALLDEFGDEWATPVLFLRAPDGNIFANVQAGPRPGRLWRRLLGWLRKQARWATAALVAILVVGVVVAVVARDDDVPVNKEGLPISEPLTDTQLLVAAGPDMSSRHVWLVDTEDESRNRQLSSGDTLEWLPVLGPDRDTMVYSRAKPGTVDSFELRTAGAGDAAGDRTLFPTPDQCEESTGRPAWSEADHGLLVLRCRNNDDVWSLLLLDVDGKVRRTYTVVDPTGKVLPSFGDVTLSPDGRTIALWASSFPRATAGSLYTVSVFDGTSALLREGDVPRQFSDLVFSPDGTHLAYRKDVGNDNYEIVTAPFSRSDRTLGSEVQLTFDPEKDEDPSFSPDGSQIAYTHRLAGGGSRIYVVDASGGEQPRPLLESPVGTYESVPAWSRR